MGIAVGNLKGLDRKAGRQLTLRYRVDDFLTELNKAAREAGLSRDQRDRMNALLDRIKDEHERRNDVAHGIWAVHGRRWSLLRYKPPEFVDFGDAKRMRARDLKPIANRVTTLTRDFEAWLDTLPKP